MYYSTTLYCNGVYFSPAKVLRATVYSTRAPADLRAVPSSIGSSRLGEVDPRVLRAVEADAVEKSGSYYRFGGKNIAQGRENMRAAMEKDVKLREAITARLQPPAKGAQKAA